MLIACGLCVFVFVVPTEEEGLTDSEPRAKATSKFINVS